MNIILMLIMLICFYYGIARCIRFICEIISNILGKTLGTIEKGINQLSEVEFTKNKEYYREILESNSPMVIGFLDDLKINKNLVIAQLLHMKGRGIITIGDGMMKRNDKNIKVKLSLIDKHILNQMHNEKLSIKNINVFIKSFETIVKKEAKKQHLVKLYKTNPRIKKLKNINMIQAYILMCIGVWMVVPYLSMEIQEISRVLDIIFGSIILLLIIYPLICYCIKSFASGYISSRGENDCKRTKKGIEINNKLEGLKNYISDFSVLSEREAKEIKLWEDYLIYSVMFGQNKKIVKEYEKYIMI